MRKKTKVMAILIILLPVVNCVKEKDVKMSYTSTSLAIQKKDTVLQAQKGIAFPDQKIYVDSIEPAIDDTFKSVPIDSLSAEPDYCVGWVDSDEKPKISIYTNPKDGYIYHAFSPQGVDLFTSTKFEYLKYEGVAESTYECWIMALDSSQKSSINAFNYYNCLIVGTKEPHHFKRPVQIEIPVSLQKLCIKALHADSLGYCDSLGHGNSFSILFSHSGIKNDYQRIAVAVNAGSASDTDFVSILETDGVNVDVLFRTAIKDLYNTSKSEGGYFVGQTDLDGDGFSDFFLLDLGDFCGKFLLIEQNGQWKIWEPYGPKP